MFGIGETELVIIVVFAFLLFGPDKLPGMGRTLGRVLRQFREASDEFTEVVQTNIMDPASEELEKSPKQRRREEAAQLDADVETPSADEGERTSRRETFAERRARLAAERQAREAQEVPDDEDSTSDADEAAHVTATMSSEASDAGDGEDQTVGAVSAASLYAISDQKSSRARAKEQERQDAATGDDVPGQSDAEQASSTSGEEDGSAQA